MMMNGQKNKTRLIIGSTLIAIALMIASRGDYYPAMAFGGSGFALFSAGSVVGNRPTMAQALTMLIGVITSLVGVVLAVMHDLQTTPMG